MRRMDRYKDEEEAQSRIDLNQELYQNVSNNTIYANITDVTNANAFEIQNGNNTAHTTREAYQQMQKYQNVSNNVVYTNITDVTNANTFEINPSQINDSKRTTRESYQQMRKYPH